MESVDMHAYWMFHVYIVWLLGCTLAPIWRCRISFEIDIENQIVSVRQNMEGNIAVKRLWQSAAATLAMLLTDRSRREFKFQVENEKYEGWDSDIILQCQMKAGNLIRIQWIFECVLIELFDNFCVNKSNSNVSCIWVFLNILISSIFCPSDHGL